MICKGILKTGGKSIEEIKNQITDLDDSLAEHYKKAFDALDGLTVALHLWDVDKDFSLYSWSEEDDTKIMKAFYHLEQGNPFEFYLNDLERFERDWKSKKYDPILSFVFEQKDVEVLKILIGG